MSTSYLDWYTNCGSTNHGMQIKWSTTDGVTLKMKVTQFLQADRLLFTSDENYATAQYYMNKANYISTSNDKYYKSSTAFCDTEVACVGSWPKVQALLIFVNESSTCTSSMICKDAIKAQILVKGKTSDCSASGCSVTAPVGNWDTTVVRDQSLSSGYTTIASSTESVTILDTNGSTIAASANLCE